MTTATKRSRKPAVKPAPTPAPNGNGRAAFDIQVDLNALTWEDMKIIMLAAEGGNKELTAAMVYDIHGLFERVVVGGAKAVPVMYTDLALAQLGEALKGLGNPKA